MHPSEIETVFATFVRDVRFGGGGQRTGKCPFHDDQVASFSFNIEKAVWKCHSGCGEGGLKDFKKHLGERGIPFIVQSKDKATRTIEAVYDYKDEDGTLLFQSIRYFPKGFSQRRPNGNGTWRSNLGGVARVLYRLPELKESAGQGKCVFVVEGEKDVENLRSRDLIATCNPMGAGKWRKEFNRHLAGRKVVVIPDHDPIGLNHARDIAESIVDVATSVKFIELPGLTQKGDDVSVWLETGHTIDELMTLVECASPYNSASSKINWRKIPQIQLPPPLSDDSLALRFTEKHCDDWRFIAAWNRWYKWTGYCWREESTLHAYDLARSVCREAASVAEKSNIASAATVSGVEKLARADRRHAATADQWDKNSWILNTPGGRVDLKTGNIKPHDRRDYLTKMTAATPNGESPAWMTFLEAVTAGDKDLQEYLARIAGYALTGETTEHAFFFFFGNGANGKSVFLNTLQAVLGDYAMTAPSETFMETANERHPTDLAGLRAARLVCSIEVDRNRRWAEAKIKSLTGGDMVSARFMRQDFFQYQPQFKLCVAGNHMPEIRGVDEAMKRRLQLVPFTVTIPPDRRDVNLSSRLMAERNGILNWAIKGCLEWQKIGLKPPPSVVNATKLYFEGEDATGRWIEEECLVKANFTTTTVNLFKGWERWAKKSGEFVGSMKNFSSECEKRGYIRWIEPVTRRRGFRGIKLK